MLSKNRREKVRSAMFTLTTCVYVEGDNGDYAARVKDLERAESRIKEVITDIRERENGN